MAAALLDHYAAGRVLVRPAGSAPADNLNLAVVESLAEFGPDVPTAFPKPLTDEAGRKIRDEIDRRVRALLAELAPAA